ncbi:MAG: hypothetical protein K8R60_02830 [Burkholderiales bacterium]|nr:hypothetical protein [Burkholderiales bacterium]
MRKTGVILAALGALLFFALIAFMFWGPMASTFRPPERQGQAMLVLHEQQPRLWVLLKQEEQRQVSYGFGSRSTGGFRNDTFFHFELQAHDVRSTAPVWKARLLTLGDREASGSTPSRVIGSSAEGRLLGQEGDTVWLLLDGQPVAVAAADGKVKATAAMLQEKNAALKGMLPTSSSLYAFDAGLVITAADAQRYRVQGATLAAQPYQPPPPPPPPPPSRWQSTRPPFGGPVVRLIRLGGDWIGLYTDREAADAAHDELGMRFNEPFTILNEGALARRTFRRAVTAPSKRYRDDKHDVLTAMTPIPGRPAYLRGQFFHVPGTEQPLAMTEPTGVLVQHQTRIDADGRVAITRIDTELQALWTATLPMTELGSRWISPKQLLLLGTEQTTKDGVRTREEQLVALDLADGKTRSWNLQKAQAAAP